jgi:HAD superfamily hydrolase (TIGR01484 family)
MVPPGTATLPACKHHSLPTLEDAVHFLALAVDYDGTIAENGYVTAETCQALRRLKESGRKLLLVTGRELVDLRHAFPDLALFDRIVAENGALLYDPSTDHEKMIAPAASSALVDRLAANNVKPLSVGRSIIATWHPHEQVILNAIRDLGLELQIIFNKDAIMVLPTNVNKASGLLHALKELDISALNVIAVGDAENDHAFLAACGCSAAVANALPSLKEAADLKLEGDHGKGIAELVERIIEEDSRMLPLSRRGILAGIDRNGVAVHLEPDDVVLLAGNSGCGKSSYVTLLTERMVNKGFEFCVIDPEGDYLALENAVTIGGLREPPTTEDALRVLLQAEINVVINTLALNADDRWRLFADLVPAIRELREKSGRPHWLLIDEAHYVLPSLRETRHPTSLAGAGAIIVTLDPESIDPLVLRETNTMIAMGSMAPQLLASYAQTLGIQPPEDVAMLANDEFLFWSRTAPMPVILRQEPPRQVHNRHSGKYATGDVGEWRAFYFPGPNVHAHNLVEFLRIADQIDDDNWQRHLRAGDYSAWFRHVIRDDVLAEKTAAIEKDLALSSQESRRRVRQAICNRYIIPAPHSAQAEPDA